MISRREFVQYWEAQQPGLGSDDSVLWVGEQHRGRPCEWFVKVRPLVLIDHDQRRCYWDWCAQNLQGTVGCYSSSSVEEWWGFTCRDDIVLWMLKWSR